jgi:hypothetical protein
MGIKTDPKTKKAEDLIMVIFKNETPKKVWQIALIFLLGQLLVLPLNIARAEDSIKDLVQRSRLIFTGTVVELRAVTVPTIKVSDNTIIVRVDELLLYTKIFANYGNKKITVLVNDDHLFKVDDQAVFFTNVRSMGESVAVGAVGYKKIDKGETAPKKQIASVLQSLEERALIERIAGAEFVVAGKVSAVRAAAETLQPQPISEHYPHWREAVIEVESTLKGDPATTRIIVRFPGNDDVAFRSIPKFKVGQSGIWILRRDRRPGVPKPRLKGKEVEAFMAQDPRDFQTNGRLEKIRQLIKR